MPTSLSFPVVISPSALPNTFMVWWDGKPFPLTVDQSRTIRGLFEAGEHMAAAKEPEGDDQ